MTCFKNLIKNTIKKILNSYKKIFFKSSDYWEKRYLSGGSSGPGSYGNLAIFKAKEINRFIEENNIKSVVEFGCGDGNQLKLANYESYTGYDVSPAAVKKCKELFKNDKDKEFFHISEYDERKADLSLSLDVLFHLIEDEVFDLYMRKLFNASSKYVIIYSSDQNEPIPPISIHVRHRKFSDWVKKEFSESNEWQLIKKVKNPYPYTGNIEKTSFCDFFFYEKIK